MFTTGGGREVALSTSYAHRVLIIGADQPYSWLRAGWRDFRRALPTSLAFGLIFVMLAFALSFGLWKFPRIDLLLPLASGFMLLVPLLSMGLHQVSREIDRPGRPSFLKDNAGSIMNAALGFLFIFLLWFRFSQIAFALAFPPMATMDVGGFLEAAFLTSGGIEFLALVLGVSACLGIVTFMGGALALAMLLDRNVGVGEAIATSFAACRVNPRAMALWAALVVGLVSLGLAFAYIGLAVALPVIGHASWHAYRATIAAR